MPKNLKIYFFPYNVFWKTISPKVCHLYVQKELSPFTTCTVGYPTLDWLWMGRFMYVDALSNPYTWGWGGHLKSTFYIFLLPIKGKCKKLPSFFRCLVSCVLHQRTLRVSSLAPIWNHISSLTGFRIFGILCHKIWNISWCLAIGASPIVTTLPRY